MKSRRRAGWLVAGMLGTSVLMMPLEGGAAVRRWWEPPIEGDPDGPDDRAFRFVFLRAGSGPLLIIKVPTQRTNDRVVSRFNRANPQRVRTR